MSTPRLVFSAVLAFLLFWATLAILAVWRLRRERAGPSAPSESATSSGLSREQIAQHNRPDDCWLVIRGNVYDVTRYIPSHPAPRRAITDYCGKESTWAFETKEGGRPHSPHAWQMLETYRLGTVRD